MSHGPDIDRFFRKLQEAKARLATLGANQPQQDLLPKRIVILPTPEGDVVAKYESLGEALGECHRAPSGEIFFNYCIDDKQRWYVNKNFSTFCEAAAIFNRFCELHKNDEDDSDAHLAETAAQLRSELEKIEPLGDPKTSLWGATIQNTEWGLLTLY